MTIDEVALATYRLPYRTPFSTAHETAGTRRGLLLRLTLADGQIGHGEAAPVAAFGTGTVEDCADLLERLAPTLPGAKLERLEDLAAELAPGRAGGLVARAALETAALDLRARRAGQPAGALLGGRPARPLPVNATIGQVEAVAPARAAVAAGFGCLKLKVGLGLSDDDEVERVGAVRAAIGPAVRLRLDANGAWPVERALGLLRRLAAYDLELVEQPVPADDLAGLAATRAAGVPIAADEAATTIEQARAVLAAGCADALVVKPMLCGGPYRAVELVREIEAAGARAIVTSTIESGVGVALALHVASTLADPVPACGLATGPLLASDLLTAPLPCGGGLMRVPAGPGLGVEVDPVALRAYGDGWRTWSR